MRTTCWRLPSWCSSTLAPPCVVRQCCLPTPPLCVMHSLCLPTAPLFRSPAAPPVRVPKGAGRPEGVAEGGLRDGAALCQCACPHRPRKHRGQLGQLLRVGGHVRHLRRGGLRGAGVLLGLTRDGSTRMLKSMQILTPSTCCPMQCMPPLVLQAS